MKSLHEPFIETLSNGIPVIFQNYEAPVAATYWWVRTGSADELPSEAGYSHFLEHMLFKDAAAKDTGTPSSGKTARAIESLGGDINAYTSFDQTVYHVTCAEQHWERVIDQFGIMAKPQRFLKADFDREREVILEELRKNEDSPGRQLFQSLFTSTFAKHPYGKPVIGTIKSLKAATVATLERYYRRRYSTQNMGIIMVGPLSQNGEISQIRKAELLRGLEKRFGASVLKKTEIEQPFTRFVEPEMRKGINAVARPFDVTTPSLAVSFRAPGLMHPDVPALDTLVGILGMGELSRLYQKLFYAKTLVTEATGGVYIPSDPGMLYFQADFDGLGKVESVAREMFKVLADISKGGQSAVTREEMERVIVNTESERLYATQSADSMAGRLGFLKFVLGDLDYDRKYLEHLRALKPEDIQNAAQKYFDLARMSVVLLHSRKDKKVSLAPVVTAAAAEFTKSPAKPAVKKAEKVSGKNKNQRAFPVPIQVWNRPSGLKVVFCERPASHVLAIQAAVMGGVRLERSFPIETPETDWGLSHMMALTWNKGTRKKTAQQISREVESRAASLDGFSGRNSMGLDLTCLARDWAPLSALFTEVLTDATFPDEEVLHSRRVAEESVRSIEDHSGQLCSKLFLETLYEHHPYRYLTIGSLESLATMNSKKLRAFRDRWVRPNQLVVSVSGPIPKAKVEEWVKDLESRLLTPATETARLILEEEPDLRAPRWSEKKMGREQIHVLVGGLGTRIGAKDRYALRLLQTILGGQSGRLFIELREKKSLAYSVSPMSFEGIERGYLGTYIASGPGKQEEAVRGIQKVYETFAKKGPTAAEINRAREYYMGRRAMDMQSDSALASHYGLNLLYGISPDDEAAEIAKIGQIDAKTLQKYCQTHWVDPPQVTTIVG